MIIDGTWKQFFPNAGAALLDQVDDLFIGTRGQLRDLGGLLGYEGDALDTAMQWWSGGGHIGDEEARVEPDQEALTEALQGADEI